MRLRRCAMCGATLDDSSISPVWWRLPCQNFRQASFMLLTGQACDHHVLNTDSGKRDSCPNSSNGWRRERCRICGGRADLAAGCVDIPLAVAVRPALIPRMENQKFSTCAFKPTVDVFRKTQAGSGEVRNFIVADLSATRPASRLRPSQAYLHSAWYRGAG